MNPIDRLRNAASAFASSANGSTSPTRTLPPLGASSVPRMFNSVDFPDPLGPTIASRSPGESARFTPLSTTSGAEGADAVGDGALDPGKAIDRPDDHLKAASPGLFDCAAGGEQVMQRDLVGLAVDGLFDQLA